MRKRLIVGISGASGAPIAVELLKALRQTEVESHLIITHSGEITIRQETDLSVETVRSLADAVYDCTDITAGPASGTWESLGMAIVPCSMKTAAGIWCGYSDNLLLRAADVTLKERKKLVLVPRETPMSSIHLRNLYELSNMGTIILPPVLSCYHTHSLEDIIRQIAGKILEQFQIETPLLQRWKGAGRE